MPVPAGLRAAVTAAIEASDNGWPINRAGRIDRTRAAVMAAIEPIVSQALTDSTERAEHEGGLRGFTMGQLVGRRDALLEAVTMLKRHGHRSAVTRVQALLDDATAAVTSQTPARPQPVTDSPAGGPGPSSPATDKLASEPTQPENGAPRGPVGPPEPPPGVYRLTYTEATNALASAQALETELRRRQQARRG